MKPGMSTLNPYAASYVPLSQRKAEDGSYVTQEDSKSHNEKVRVQTPDHNPVDLRFIDSSTHGAKMSESFHVKSQTASSSYSLSSQNLTDKKMLDEESELDLEYLRVTFPGISDQSLADVYMVNRGDLDAAIDMLNILEVMF